MNIRCSVGDCDPCRNGISLKVRDSEHFCFKHFKEYYSKFDGYSPIIYNGNMYDDMLALSRKMYSEHNINMAMQEQYQVDTEDIVGECCGEVS